jgi:alpha-mannosidase
VTALRRAQAGPHVATVEVDLKIHESEFTLTYELRAGDPRLHLGLKGTWFQRGTPQTGIPVLNFVLPLAVTGAKARYEIPFGAVDRELNHREEVPALRWAQVTGRLGDETAGCLLLNDCKHGHSLEANTLRLTLIRSSYDPDILPEIGQHEVHLAILPFSGDLAVTDAIQQGQLFNHAVRVVSTDLHPGELPAQSQLVRVRPEGVLLSGIKKSEEGDLLVLRLFNPTSRKATARIECDPALLGKVVEVTELDLLERPLSRSGARIDGGRAVLGVPARGIATVGIKLRKA